MFRPHWWKDARLRTVNETESHSFPVTFFEIIRFQYLLKMELVLKKYMFLFTNLFIGALYM